MVLAAAVPGRTPEHVPTQRVAAAEHGPSSGRVPVKCTAAPGLGPGCGEQVSCLNVGREVNAIALAPDGRRVVLGLQDHTLHIWDLEAKVVVRVLRGHKYWVNHVAYSWDGVRVASASADKTVKVWNAAVGQCEVTLSGHLLSVAAVAFSDDATRLASGSWDKTVCIWDVEKERALLTLHGHSDWVHSVAWAPGGRQLASASSDHSVRVWSIVTGLAEQVLVGHIQTVSSLSFASGGIFLASGSLDRTFRVWNLQEGSLVACHEQESAEGSVRSVAFAPDGERVVVGCSDRSLKVWNLRTGEQEGELCGHEEPVLGVCISPDGSRAVSCSHDKTVRVWTMPSGRPALDDGPRPVRVLEAGARNDAYSVSTSFRDLHERLRSTEDTNQLLRRQLSEAKTEIEEKTWRVQRGETSLSEQERELTNYRRMVSSLAAEKEKLERSFFEMRRELRQLPAAPAGHGIDPSSPSIRPEPATAAAASGVSSTLAAMQLGPAGGRRSVLPMPAGPAVASSKGAADEVPRAMLRIHHPAGSPAASEDPRLRSETPRRGPGASCGGARPEVRRHPSLRPAEPVARAVSPLPGHPCPEGLRGPPVVAHWAAPGEPCAAGPPRPLGTAHFGGVAREPAYATPWVGVPM
mmetsp:Transcript_94927/g.306441  ORF Transcript_94927/g.306441 Transcript_94927/m.306441 type:complete len:635 (-) Transcript_94927:37-1941(-)